MILLEATNSKDIYLVIEKIIIVCVILYQLYASYFLSIKIKNFSKIFDEKFQVIKGRFDKTRISISTNILLEVKNNSINKLTYVDSRGNSLHEVEPANLITLSLVDTSSENEVINRIKNTLNSYLINNYGASVNFSIIRDIVDREIDVNDETISQSLPLPLYLGLAATMIGIILGLFSMPEINGDGFTEGINSLINGVKFAMIASLFGLGLTTYLSTFIYKNAKERVLIDKNNQLSYLQAELLPELVKAEDTGISGLKASLDRFAREATTISANVLSASAITNENIQKQNEVIEKVERLNMTKISRVNLELFHRIESNFVMLNKFNGYITALNNISENLVEFSKRSSDVEIISNEIKENMMNSNAIIRLIETHTTALTTHIQQIEKSGGAASAAVNAADSAFREAIERLQIEINNRENLLSASANKIDTDIQNHFNSIGAKLIEVTSTHLNELSSAYQCSIPSFEMLDNLEKLDNLNHLPEIKESTTHQSEQLLTAIYQLNQSLRNINSSIDNQSVLNKLDEIEKCIKQKKLPISPNPNPEKPSRISFIKNLRNSFNKKEKTKNHEE